MLNTITKAVKNQVNKTQKTLIFQAFPRLKGMILSVTFTLLSHQAFAQTVIGSDEITDIGNDIIATLILGIRIVFSIGFLVLSISFALKQRHWGWVMGFGITAASIAFGPEFADHIFKDTDEFYVED